MPGESFLGFLDALDEESRIRVVTTRHEGAASFMAEAYAKLTGRPTVCAGTRTVGAGNLAIGIHTAQQDSSPLIAIFGQVTTERRGREAFQESELVEVFRPLVKWAVEPLTAERISELTLRACQIALNGRPGAVVVALREDIQHQLVPEVPVKPLFVARPAPEPGLLSQVISALRASINPLLLLGGGVIAAGATHAAMALAEFEEIPVVASWRRPDVFPNAHRLYLGHIGLGAPRCVAERLRTSDLILAVGTRLSEITTVGYTLPAAHTKLLHVDIDPQMLGGHSETDPGIVADAAIFFEQLLLRAQEAPPSMEMIICRRMRNKVDHEVWERAASPTRGRARPEYVDQQYLVAVLNDVLTPDTIVTTDAGNFSGWIVRYLRRQQPRSFLAPTSGAMGYGLPAAIAAKLAYPGRKVVGIAGDGGFLMTGSELETAVREAIPLTMIVVDNQQYGTIRMYQEKMYPGRPVGTSLGAVDFAAYARSLGALGLSVHTDSDLRPALEEALPSPVPIVVHVKADPEQVSVELDGAEELTPVRMHGLV